MNYLKNKKRNLIRLTQGSILISSIAIPTITNTNSASAMFNTLARKTVTSTSTTPGVRTLITQFEKISHSSSSKATLKRTTLGSNPGFNYMNPYQQPSGSSSNKKPFTSRILSKLSLTSKSSKSSLSSTQQSLLKTPTNEATSSSPTTPKQALLPPGYTQSTNTKPVDESTPSLSTTSKKALLPPTSDKSTQLKPNTKPPIAPKPTPKSILLHKKSNDSQTQVNQHKVRFNLQHTNEPSSNQHIYDEVEITTSTTNTNSPTSGSSINQPTYNKVGKYTLKIGQDLGKEYDPYIPTKQQQSTLESMIKTTVAAIVKNNLPEGFPRNQPVTIQFDNESGQHLNAALSSFLLRSAIKTLNVIDSQQQT